MTNVPAASEALPAGTIGSVVVVGAVVVVVVVVVGRARRRRRGGRGRVVRARGQCAQRDQGRGEGQRRGSASVQHRLAACPIQTASSWVPARAIPTPRSPRRSRCRCSATSTPPSSPSSTRRASGCAQVFRTANALTLPISGTGSAGMEAAFVNVVGPGDVVVVGVNGVFGERMCDVASRCGAEVVAVREEWGRADRSAAAARRASVAEGHRGRARRDVDRRAQRRRTARRPQGRRAAAASTASRRSAASPSTSTGGASTSRTAARRSASACRPGSRRSRSTSAPSTGSSSAARAGTSTCA